LKRTTLICLSLVACASAFGQVQLYNNLNTNFDNGWWDNDGGINDEGTNFGGQIGQVITDLAAGDTISNIESYYVGFESSSAASGMFVEVFNFSGGVVGSLVGSENVGVASENDSVIASGALAGLDMYDIDANVDIGGLIAGQQYLVTMQAISGNAVYQGINNGNNPDTYYRDFSQFGYAGIYGAADWTELSTINGVPADATMAIQATTATPEPISLGVLGFGALALLRRRRAGASR
jgi:MYXO-CTERM domain-containing protein